MKLNKKHLASAFVVGALVVSGTSFAVSVASDPGSGDDYGQRGANDSAGSLSRLHPGRNRTGK